MQKFVVPGYWELLRQGGMLAAVTCALALPAVLPFDMAKAQAATQATPEPASEPAPAEAAPQPPVETPAAIPLPTLAPAQRAQLVAMIDSAAAQGLRHDVSALKNGASKKSDEELMRAALDYARAVHSGRLDAGDFQRDWALRPAPYDPLPGFADAVAKDRLSAWIASLPPPYAGYDGLRRGLANYRAIEAAGGWTALVAGPDMTIGATGPRVQALRQRLAIEDRQVSTKSDVFDQELLDAVRRAQRRYGLNPSGIVSTQTVAALNVPISIRVRQIMANMERWRWLPADLPRDRIQVNIAAAVLTVFEGDNPVLSMRAVTGRPGDETPMLQSGIHSVVINPPWNVPTSIATKELWPKERANPGYLRRNGFRVITNPDGSTRLQQMAGTQSALGRLKFDFDNPFAVYLHDTPTQATFARYSRLASHGCVRLEKPLELAQHLFRNDPKWSGDAIKAGIDKNSTVRVRLEKPVNVYLLYWTAFASSNGQISFRGDPYGWDEVLATKIEASAARAALAVR